MINQLSIDYNEYYKNLAEYNFDGGGNIIQHIADYFDNSILKLQIIDTIFLFPYATSDVLLVGCLKIFYCKYMLILFRYY